MGKKNVDGCLEEALEALREEKFEDALELAASGVASSDPNDRSPNARSCAFEKIIEECYLRMPLHWLAFLTGEALLASFPDSVPISRLAVIGLLDVRSEMERPACSRIARAHELVKEIKQPLNGEETQVS
jgi:hypothetical protein